MKPDLATWDFIITNKKLSLFHINSREIIATLCVATTFWTLWHRLFDSDIYWIMAKLITATPWRCGFLGAVRQRLFDNEN
jgi:hypothetical protein